MQALTAASSFGLEGEHLTPRRIRHISGIQVRNLTPFPVRDAFTSALDQPIDTGGFINELGTSPHSRRISTASTATRRTTKRDDNVVEQDIIVPSDKRSSTSRITFSSTPSSPDNTPRQRLSSRSLRVSRPRTSSMTSSAGIQRLSSSVHLSPSSSLLPSNSQASLEKVIGSRLVETFIVISIPPKDRSPGDVSHIDPSRTPQSAPVSKTTFTLPSTRSAEKNKKHSRETSTSSSRTKGHGVPRSAVPASTSSLSTLKADSRKASLRSTPKSSPPAKGNARAVSKEGKVLRKVAPIYFSPIHRPSTSPYFAIDARAGRDLPNGSDDFGQTMEIEIWGKMSNSDMEGKLQGGEEYKHRDWRVLDHWDVDLDELVLLPDDFETSSSQLSSNTLVLSLQPPGKRYYLPSSTLASGSRSESPLPGYSSDPESGIRKVRQIEKQLDPVTTSAQTIGHLSSWKRRQRGNGSDPSDLAKTVTWQELFKLVTLHSLIVDTRASLNNVVESISDVVERDKVFPLVRDLSERESRIREWRKNHCVVLDQIAQQKQDLTERAQRLRERQECLSSANKAISFNAVANLKVEKQRVHLFQLRQQSMSIQTCLISSLSMIYPIEMYSSTDLLFTILGVPLPIPLKANDPAPPLILPEHKDVTEETVAAALGYVAQVLQLLAAYMGQNLVYPVTCIGSRSLIRDGISTMVGPRMFPLFSKGVDTYRFEYAVFLLNKNVETLMGERDLRALDMRQTLPNLKNLLLTLSHDVAEVPSSRIVPSIPTAESLAQSPLFGEATTPKATHSKSLSMSTVTESTTTPPESGANTPTVSGDEQRKGKSSFLGFGPFIRVRYPSQSSEKTIGRGNATMSGEVLEDAEGNEEERRTIQYTSKGLGVAVPAIGSEGTVGA